jgi:hypothetical protein
LDPQCLEDFFLYALIPVPALVAVFAEHVKDEPRLAGLSAYALVELTVWNKSAHSYGFPDLRLMVTKKARPAPVRRTKIRLAIPHYFRNLLICH